MNKTSTHIALINPKSPANVGAVMRAAGCFQVDSVCYTGERYDRAARFATDTKDVSRDIPLTAVRSPLDGMTADMKLVCVELCEGATPLPKYCHPTQALYVFGPEDGTISQAIIDRADAVVYVPTIGCLNLAASVNVLLYDRIAKAALYPDGDERVRRSRDTNNNTRIRNFYHLI
jgi:tRNA(Leu) C34 or U34 (ribose-2'-O)-methylase TrmL